MGIWDRLGNVLKSYLNDTGNTSYNSPQRNAGRTHDPDFEAAYEELDEFLNGGPSAGPDSGGGNGRKKQVPEEFHDDFAELGISPDAPADECKAAYKRLLKIHHPDRHTGHEGNMKKATEKTARINAAYRRLERWFQANP